MYSSQLNNLAFGESFESQTHSPLFDKPKPTILNELISISEKNAMEEESKNVDNSKQMRDANVGNDDEIIDNNSSNILK